MFVQSLNPVLVYANCSSTIYQMTWILRWRRSTSWRPQSPSKDLETSGLSCSARCCAAPESKLGSSAHYSRSRLCPVPRRCRNSAAHQKHRPRYPKQKHTQQRWPNTSQKDQRHPIWLRVPLLVDVSDISTPLPSKFLVSSNKKCQNRNKRS